MRTKLKRKGSIPGCFSTLMERTIGSIMVSGGTRTWGHTSEGQGPVSSHPGPPPSRGGGGPGGLGTGAGRGLTRWTPSRNRGGGPTFGSPGAPGPGAIARALSTDWHPSEMAGVPDCSEMALSVCTPVLQFLRIVSWVAHEAHPALVI